MLFGVGSFFLWKKLEIRDKYGYNIYYLFRKGNTEMNKFKKATPIIIVCCIVLAVLIAGLIWSRRVPALKDDVEKKSSFDTSRTYIVTQAPNSDDPLQNTETRVGIEAYWQANHKFGYALEAPMQVTKDGEIVVLSGDLAETDAASLYGKNNASVDALTLAQLQKVNLLYNVKDEDGEYSFRDVSDNAKPSVSVMGLAEYLSYVNECSSTKALYILRFRDEDKVSGWTGVLDKIYSAVSGNNLLTNVVICINNKGGIQYISDVMPKLLRAASDAELHSLVRASKFGVEKKDLPYVLVYGTNKMIGSEKFVHYAKNCGLAVIVQDGLDEPTEQVVQDLRACGVNAIATHAPTKTAEFLQNAIQAEKAERANAG